MISKYVLSYHEVQKPIIGLVTKFGGQPTWFGEPQWPLSRSTGQPMQFVCQIALDSRIFGEVSGRIAYLFVTDSETLYPLGILTDEPDGGENAVIIQPGNSDISTIPLLAGPTLYKRICPLADRAGDRTKYLTQDTHVPCEFSVETVFGEDPVSFHSNQDDDFDLFDESLEEVRGSFWRYLDEDKIGGTPAYLQEEQQEPFLAEEHWRLLLQLNGQEERFFLPFGEAGVGYVFLSEDGMRGKFFWQSM